MGSEDCDQEQQCYHPMQLAVDTNVMGQIVKISGNGPWLPTHGNDHGDEQHHSEFSALMAADPLLGNDNSTGAPCTQQREPRTQRRNRAFYSIV